MNSQSAGDPSVYQSANVKPVFGLPTLVCIVIAGMIGAGVFTTTGYSLLSLRSAPLVLLAWAIGGLVALCGAFAYGELARRMPQSGGEYLYLTQQLHPFAGFLSGWISLTAGFSGAIAFAAMTCEQYAIPDAVRPEWLPAQVVASVIVIICGAGHSWLIRPAATVQNSVVAVKLLAILVFVGLGLNYVSANAPSWKVLANADPETQSNIIYELASSVMWISLSYAGFNQAIYIASEVVNPQRNIPRALLIGTLCTTVIYLVLNFVFLSSAPTEQLAGQLDVAAISARAIGGSSLEIFMRTIIAVATLSSVASMIMTGPRVYARMADDGVFPSFFSSQSGGIHRSVLLQTCLALLLIHQSTAYELLKYLGTTLSLSSALTVITVLLPFRADSSGAGSVSSAWRYKLAAFAYVSSTMLFVTLMTLGDVKHLAGTAVTVVLGAVLWVLVPANRKRFRG